MTTSQIIKANWKNAVRFSFQGTTLTELKAFVKTQIEKENNSYAEWKIRNSDEFKEELNKKINA